MSGAHGILPAGAPGFAPGFAPALLPARVEELGRCQGDHPGELAPADPSDLRLLVTPGLIPPGMCSVSCGCSQVLQMCCESLQSSCGHGHSGAPVSRAGCPDLLLL